eukprot:SM000087S23401  [mRNA]  locus=s87:460403:460753:- [translate_table: standard]
MDWQGQKLAEQLMQWTILAAAAAAFAAGYAASSYRLMMAVYGGGVVLAAVLAVPDWRYFNQHPLPWLPASAAAASTGPVPSKGLAGSAAGGSAGGGSGGGGGGGGGATKRTGKAKR